MKNKLRILLVSISKTAKYSNAGIDLIAGFLREKGYCVDIKYFHLGESFDEMTNQLLLDYDVYGMSVYSSNYESFLQLSKYLKSKCAARIVWGGAFPSMYYKDILETSNIIDHIILGDGEMPFLHILERIENNTDIHHPSIASPRDCEGKRNACNGSITYHAAYDFYNSVRPERNKEKIHCIQSKNNVCTGNCSFCYERKGRIVYKSIDLIADEIKYVSENYGVKKFFFSDDNLLDPNDRAAKERMVELCTKLLGLGKTLIFTCYIKAISFDNSEFDSKVLSLMRKAGFTTMFIGIESGNEEDLMLYNKKTTVNDNLNIIHLLKEHDIIPQVGFINFNPYTTSDKLKKNYEFLVKIHSNNLYSFACSFMNVYKGTEIYNKAKADGLINPAYTILDDLEYDFLDQEVKTIVRFLREKLIPKIKQLKVETSWLIQRCKDCSVINPQAGKHLEWLTRREAEEAEVIKEYFGYLYKDRDIGKCELELDRFLAYFTDAIPELDAIYKDILRLYLESEE